MQTLFQTSFVSWMRVSRLEANGGSSFRRALMVLQRSPWYTVSYLLLHAKITDEFKLVQLYGCQSLSRWLDSFPSSDRRYQKAELLLLG